MKKRLLGALLAIALGTTAHADAPRLAPTVEQAQAAYLGSMFLSRYHYAVRPLDDALSSEIFDRYLKSLDPERLYFTQADIDGFADLRTRLDDAILQSDLQAPFALFQRFDERVAERFADARKLLQQDFDFSVAESYPLDRSKAPWPKDDDEARDLWRKRVKNDWLRLKLAGKDSQAIRDTLSKRYDNALARSRRTRSDDVFQTFMNAYAGSIEPHTSYLGRGAADSFDISMRLSLVGIGAVLQERDEYITIRELSPGGPAARSGKLAAGDRIVGVGQGDGSPVVDVVGARVDEVVKMIRGTKDTRVVLDILPAGSGPDAQHKNVTLVRDKIKLEEQAARKSVIPGSAGKRIGVITLPAFYEDFEGRRRGDKDFRSASRDVARLAEELKKEGVSGLILDLRNNGGGSLREAVELTGLFIDTGPVVQQRGADGKIAVESDLKAGVVWNGPLAVMINRGSASASEILAAALQDYGRALIIGEPSFGKGTVQTLVDLDRVANNEKPVLGEIKMTIAQFFRVNGGTTQLKGVTPDIRFPSAFEADEFGETGFDNALPWREITPASYQPAGTLQDILPELQRRHEARSKDDKSFRELQEDVAEVIRIKEMRSLSLVEAERKQEKEAREARLKARNGKDAEALRDDGLQSGERSLKAELASEKAFKDRKDFLLEETARIVADAAVLAPTPAATPTPASQSVAKAR
ncbi:carboxy terminal-processing peptidase [Zoogloea dura]|jgi:carboxyl-terminal processing protease|uniref:Carboxy terminal-processing peptidase n=1 Tax=Zoogloea dura TaxID=2728840 RepID=A0A848G6S5_9RHOO|nr:carboxy terminal-processing peptidase [Zoogloea dura]NML27937.1 carboxy terminal-processing peptidase [Zoogloea dura]